MDHGLFGTDFEGPERADEPLSHSPPHPHFPVPNKHMFSVDVKQYVYLLKVVWHLLWPSLELGRRFHDFSKSFVAYPPQT